MAKSTTRKSARHAPRKPSSMMKERDRKTVGKIEALAQYVAKTAYRGGEIAVDIPARSRSNTIWDRKKTVASVGLVPYAAIRHERAAPP